MLYLNCSVPWVGLQYVIVAVPGHTYLFTVYKDEIRALVNCFTQNEECLCLNKNVRKEKKRFVCPSEKTEHFSLNQLC